MWVFDGEQWIDEGGSASEQKNKTEQKQFRIEEFLPELQVVEMVVQVPRTSHVPPFPLP